MVRDDGTPRVLRVAIVGLGPKGLFALERLLDRVGDAPIEVVAYEAHPTPGAGPVYDPAQPSYLRMNNAAEHVDLWWPANATVPAAERRSFVAWDGERHGGRGAFAPRAAVGRYLADGLRTVLHHAGAHSSVRIEAERVVEIRRDGASWSVRTDHGAALRYDEVLVATGHAWGPDPAVRAGWKNAAPLVPEVFPVARRLGPDVVPAGATVALRGFALTAIDAALALTEGRGGRFVAGAGPHRLRYVPGGDDVRAVVPFSRTGRPLLPKPASALHDGLPVLVEDGDAGRRRVRAIEGGSIAAVAALEREVAAVAAAALAAVDAPGDDPAPAAWLAGRDDGVRPTVLAQLSHGLDVAVGTRPPGTEWALGHAWRTLYPAVVDRFGGPALDDAGWAAFRDLAVRLERVAFGPSASNVAKLLALAEVGILDLDHVDGALDEDPATGTRVRSARGARAVDVVVDAVLAGPGVPARDDGPIAGLLARGDLRLLPGRRGLDVGPDGACRDPAGDDVPGLAAIGRPTEDAVIGHDTLSRTLHHQADRWALRVAGRAGAAGPRSLPAGGPPDAERPDHPTDPLRTRVEEPA